MERRARRDDLPDDYLRDASAHNVLATVHCEAEMDRTKQVAETERLTGVNARRGFPGAIVAHAWFHTDDAGEAVLYQVMRAPTLSAWLESELLMSPS